MSELPRDSLGIATSCTTLNGKWCIHIAPLSKEPYIDIDYALHSHTNDGGNQVQRLAQGHFDTNLWETGTKLGTFQLPSSHSTPELLPPTTTLLHWFQTP